MYEGLSLHQMAKVLGVKTMPIELGCSVDLIVKFSVSICVLMCFVCVHGCDPSDF